MADFFTTLLDYIKYFFSFIINIIESLTLAITSVVNAQNFILVILGYMPAIIGASFATFFFIYLLKFILGR